MNEVPIFLVNEVPMFLSAHALITDLIYLYNLVHFNTEYNTIYNMFKRKT